MEMTIHFKNRMQAGELLAQKLIAYAGRSDVVVLALPRGGVPVGYAIARKLDVPLDVVVVRKLGMPGQEEYAMGAIASGGICVLQPDVVNKLRVSTSVIEVVKQRELQEIERREKLYRAGRTALHLHECVVILVDDGIATGSTMHAAVKYLKNAKPARVIIAVPVAAYDTFRQFRSEVDEIICLSTPDPFYAVGLWYDDFGQTSDEEVKVLMERAELEHGKHYSNYVPQKNYASESRGGADGIGNAK